MTAKGKAAAMLHIQILDAADDSGISRYLREKQNILQLPKKKITNSSCCNSEQNTSIAAKKTVSAIQEEFQASKRPDLPNLWCIVCSKSMLSF